MDESSLDFHCCTYCCIRLKHQMFPKMKYLYNHYSETYSLSDEVYILDIGCIVIAFNVFINPLRGFIITLIASSPRHLFHPQVMLLMRITFKPI